MNHTGRLRWLTVITSRTVRGVILATLMYLTVFHCYKLVQADKTEPNLAILQFMPINIDAAAAESITVRMQSEFVRLRRYVVIDRDRINRLLEEQQLQQSDCTDAACAVKAGKILQSQWVVMGSVSRVEDAFQVVTDIVDVGSSQIVNSTSAVYSKLTELLNEIPAMVQELARASTIAQSDSGQSSAQPAAIGQKGGAPTSNLPPVKRAPGKAGAHPALPVVTGHGSPPTIELLETPKARLSLKDAKSVRFRYRGEDDQCSEGYRYRLDDQEMVSDKRAGVEFSNLAGGSHTFQVQAVDCEGNYSAGVSFTFEVANLPPEIAIVSPRANEKVSGKQLRIELQGFDADGTVIAYRCALNNPSAAKEQKSPVFLFDAADGKALIFAQVTDDGGAESEWEQREVEFMYQDDARKTAPNSQSNNEQTTAVALPAGFVLIPAGSFLMGSPRDEKCRSEYEDPMQSVTITKSFFMATTETTGARFAAFMRKAIYACKAVTTPKDHPVTTVTWYDAVAYCNWLSDSEGLQRCYSSSGNVVHCDPSTNGYRLPTEAEWEYACRAGTSGLFNTGDDIDGVGSDSRSTALDKAGWYVANSNGKTHPVGQKSPNAWGLYDMHGNVWEWCWDRYGGYSSASSSDPHGPSFGVERVMRGGFFGNGAAFCRSANRGSGIDPSSADSAIGFRVDRLAPQN